MDRQRESRYDIQHILKSHIKIKFFIIELAFQLLTTLPPNEVVKIVDRISPYLHCDILSVSSSTPIETMSNVNQTNAHISSNFHAK